MSKMWAIIFLLALAGCKNFETQKLSSKELVDQELKQIDWKEVDRYPTFVVCQDYNSQEEVARCFAKVISEEIYKNLQQREINFKDSITEKAWLFISISEEGKTQLDSLQQSAKLQESLPNLKDWLQVAVRDLPKVYPAQKRGIPVATNFRLPIRFETE